jgi:hypothetical protein
VGEFTVTDGVVGGGVDGGTETEGVVGLGGVALDDEGLPTKTPMAMKPKTTTTTTAATISTMPVLLRGERGGVSGEVGVFDMPSTL